MKMRTEQEMMELIISVAKGDERIRAVFMNGSRTNVMAPKDLFQDYDIVYIVTDLSSFLEKPNWIDVFGERMIMQKPDEMDDEPRLGRYAYLMQFMDGNRIDLTLIDKKEIREYLFEDKLTLLLYNKDIIEMPKLESPTDKDYWVKKPDNKAYYNCCNEFWWIAPYIAKGLWRKEILYAKGMFDFYLRPMLLKMLSWEVGIATDFMVSVGKMGKYLNQYLAEEQFQKYQTTYTNATYNVTWDALFEACELFHIAAIKVGECLNYEYSHEEDEKVTKHLRQIRYLPTEATSIYDA